MAELAASVFVSRGSQAGRRNALANPDIEDLDQPPFGEDMRSCYPPFTHRSSPCYQRWFTWPNILFTAQVPLLVTIVAAGLAFSLRRRHERLPFLLALALLALSMIGLGISVFPDIVPGRISIHEAAAPETSLIFMLVGAGILIPVILAYTAHAYWIFRGKVGHEGYH